MELEDGGLRRDSVQRRVDAQEGRAGVLELRRRGDDAAYHECAEIFTSR